MIAPDNSQLENPHQRKFPPRITPTGKIPTQKTPTRIIAIQKILSNPKQYSAEAILCNQYCQMSNDLIITPPLNKQQGDPEISENPVSQKKCFENLFIVKEKSSKQ